MVFSQNLISILLSKPDKQADMQMSFFGADPLPKTPDHQKKFVAHQNSNFFILSYALADVPGRRSWTGVGLIWMGKNIGKKKHLV